MLAHYFQTVVLIQNDETSSTQNIMILSIKSDKAAAQKPIQDILPGEEVLLIEIM